MTRVQLIILATLSLEITIRPPDEITGSFPLAATIAPCRLVKIAKEPTSGFADYSSPRTATNREHRNRHGVGYTQASHCSGCGPARCA